MRAYGAVFAASATTIVLELGRELLPPV